MTALSLLASIALLVVAALVRPARASCPVGYDLRTGVRRDGHFECWPNVTGSSDADGTWLRPERGAQPAGVLVSRVYCGDAEPIVVDARTVGCWARASR